MFLTKKVYKTRRRKEIAGIKKNASKSGGKKFALVIEKNNRNMSAYLMLSVDGKVLTGFSTASKEFQNILSSKGIKNRVSKVSCFEFGVELYSKIFSNVELKSHVTMEDLYLNRGSFLFHGRVKSFWEGFVSCVKCS